MDATLTYGAWLMIAGAVIIVIVDVATSGSGKEQTDK